MYTATMLLLCIMCIVKQLLVINTILARKIYFQNYMQHNNLRVLMLLKSSHSIEGLAFFYYIFVINVDCVPYLHTRVVLFYTFYETAYNKYMKQNFGSKNSKCVCLNWVCKGVKIKVEQLTIPFVCFMSIF